MVNPQASLSNGSGTWHAAPSRTAVRFELEAGDAGAFLGRVGYPGLVKGARTRLQGALSWQGDPGTLDFATLAGDVQMQAEEGQFLEIEPGIGKLISLMSLQALPSASRSISGMCSPRVSNSIASPRTPSSTLA